MPAIDMTEICKKYRGLWVALTDENEVVAAGEDGKKVYEEARAKGTVLPILFHVPSAPGFFIGWMRIFSGRSCRGIRCSWASRIL